MPPQARAYSIEGDKRVALSTEEMSARLSAGQPVYFEQGAPVTMINAQGVAEQVDPADVTRRMALGERIEGAEHLVRREDKEQHTTPGQKALAVAEGAVSGATIGLAPLAVGIASEFDPDIAAYAESAQKRRAYNPDMAFGGEMAGTVGMAALSRGAGVISTVGRLAEQGAAARLGTGFAGRALSYGAREATEGAIYGLGAGLGNTGLSRELWRDPEAAAQHIVTSVGIGALTGGVIGTGGGIVSGAGSVLRAAASTRVPGLGVKIPGADELAEGLAMRGYTLGHSTAAVKVLKSVRPGERNLQRMILDEGLTDAVSDAGTVASRRTQAAERVAEIARAPENSVFTKTADLADELVARADQVRRGNTPAHDAAAADLLEYANRIRNPIGASAPPAPAAPAAPVDVSVPAATPEPAVPGVNAPLSTSVAKKSLDPARTAKNRLSPLREYPAPVGEGPTALGKPPMVETFAPPPASLPSPARGIVAAMEPPAPPPPTGITSDVLLEMKRGIDQELRPVYGGGKGGMASRELAWVRTKIADAIEETIAPANMAEWKAANRDYQAWNRLKEIGDAVQKREMAASLQPDSIGSVMGAASLAGGVASMNPGLVAGGVGAMLRGPATKFARVRGPQLLARLVDSFSKSKAATKEAAEVFAGVRKPAPLPQGRPAGRPAGIDKAFEERVARMPRTLEETVQRVAGALDGLDVEHPALMTALVASTVRASEFLRSKLPMPEREQSTLTPQASKPFISKAQKAEFLRIANAIDNPESVILDLAKGTVDLDAVEALKTVAPLKFAELRQEVAVACLQRRQPLPYKRRVLAGLIFDFVADDSMDPEYVSFLQSNIQAPDPGQEGPSAPAQPTGKPIKLPTETTRAQELQEMD